MSVASEITRISTAKSDIKKSMERLGYTVPSATKIDGYAEILDPRREGKILDYKEKPSGENYLTFKFIEDGSLYFRTTNPDFTRTIQYIKWTVDTQHNTWTSFTSTIDGYMFDVNAGDEVWIKSTETVAYGSATNHCSFYNTGFAYISGNILSLMNWSSSALPTRCFTELFMGCTKLDIDVDAGGLLLPSTSIGNYCYNRMFAGCSNLTTTPALPATTLGTCCYSYMFFGTSITSTPTLSATTLKSYCYQSMFRDCKKLTTVTTLPATTLTEGCYTSMFFGCTSLVNPPALQSTSLASHCYSYMLYGCTALITAPELPATTMKTYCYQYMFDYCISLTSAPALPATTLATQCYYYMFADCYSLKVAPNLPATTLGTYCYSYMFFNCINLIVAPNTLPATTLTDYCYYYMFVGCTRLKTAPDLPALTLVNNCYSRMFSGCSSLNYIRALFTTTPSTSYTNVWVSGVASSGTFIKNPDATWTTTGTSAVPTTWTIGTHDDVYLTIESTTNNNSIKWYTSISNSSTRVISVSTDNGLTWTEKTPTLLGCTLATLNKGQKIIIKGNNTTYYNRSEKNHFGSDYEFNVYGNIMSLINNGVMHNNSFNNTNYVFEELFSRSKVVDCSNLRLPVTTLTSGCYQDMFSGCVSLITAPELPATTLASDCYYGMFRECSSLTKAPDLLARNGVENCYRQMFENCKGLSYVKCMLDRPSASYTRDWLKKVNETGEFVYDKAAAWDEGDSGIPVGWTSIAV